MIVIIGDSWGVGEWAPDFTLSGPGIGQYLMLSTGVINLSMASASNTQCLGRLEGLLSQFCPCQEDEFYWVVTCPTRCSTAEKMLQVKDLDQAILDLLHQSLQKANDIAERSDIRINVIGGLADLDDIDISAYDRLVMRVPSWCGLLQPNSARCLIEDWYWSDLGPMIRQHRPDLLPQWTCWADRIGARQRSWEDMKQSFWGADHCHPDRRGHLRLRDHLWPQWSDKF